MANKEKRLLLIRQLTDFTRQRALRWEKTSQQGTFMATFPNSAVRISRNRTLVPELSFSLQIIDAKGDVTETITGTAFQVTLPTPDEISPIEAYEPLALLYQVVSHQVEAESDKTIDDVFEELKRLNAEGAKAS